VPFMYEPVESASEEKSHCLIAVALFWSGEFVKRMLSADARTCSCTARHLGSGGDLLAAVEAMAAALKAKEMNPRRMIERVCSTRWLRDVRVGGCRMR